MAAKTRRKVEKFGTGPRGGTILVFNCPGCGNEHPFEINCPHGDGWTWNGSYSSPTFTPSLLCNKDVPSSRCHLFLIDGKINYGSDCHHRLAGCTVEAPDYEDEA